MDRTNTRGARSVTRRSALTRAALAVAAVAYAGWPHAGRAQFTNSGYQFPGWSSLTPAALPSVPTDVRHGFSGGQPLSDGPDGGWTILPYINISGAFNDNIFQTPSHRAADFITYITPGITLRGESSRLQGQVFYAPTGMIYADHGSQDMLAQRLNGAATLTLVPEAAFVLLRGFASVQPTFGGLPGANGFSFSPSFGLGQSDSGPLLTRSTATQSQTYSVAPYAVHRFGSFGTVKAGVSYSYTNSTPLGNSLALPVALQGSGGSLNTYNEVLQFGSGEDFGRWRNLALATGTQFAGTGVTDNAYQYIVSNEIGYAIRHDLVLFAELGWENIRFSGTPATRIDDAVWAVGTHWTPAPDSSVTLGYGHQYGTDSVLFNAGFVPTARTHLYAQYQTGLGTNLTQLQSYALATDVDPFGTSVDPTSGTPLNLVNNTLGVTGNTNLYQTKTLSASAALDLDRDLLSVQIAWQDQKLLATTSSSGATSSSGLSAILGWQHQLTPDLVGSAYASYGRQSGNSFASFAAREIEDTYGAQVSLRYSITPTLSGVVQYNFTDRIANVPGLSFTQNVVLVGLTKQF